MLKLLLFQLLVACFTRNEHKPSKVPTDFAVDALTEGATPDEVQNVLFWSTDMSYAQSVDAVSKGMDIVRFNIERRPMSHAPEHYAAHLAVSGIPAAS